MRTIHSPSAGTPHGHYAQAIEHGGTIYVSGILGNADAANVAPIEDQAEHCLNMLDAILRGGGSGLDRVLKLGVFVMDLDSWPRVNAVCAARFGDHRPARIVVPCGPLRLGALIEIDAIAASGEEP